MEFDVTFNLSYEGNSAEEHEIDLYDVAQALMGFQRSIALTTHLVLNNKVITKAPYLKGAKIYALPPEEGSWTIKAGILISAGFLATTAQKDTPLGNIIHSAYDYVISESLGFHVDYEKSLGLQYEEITKTQTDNDKGKKQEKNIPIIEQYQFDSVIEKCTTAVAEMHRPIIKTKTAESAEIISNIYGEELEFSPVFSQETYEYMHEHYIEENAVLIEGRISSYNSNTFKGRVYVPNEGRPVSFELSKNCRNDEAVKLIVASLSENAVSNHKAEWSVVYCIVVRTLSRSGHLKSYNVLSIHHTQPNVK